MSTGFLGVIPKSLPAVDQVGTLQNGCRPRITSFDLVITVNNAGDIVCRPKVYSCRQQILYVWYMTGSVDSTGSTNGVTPMGFGEIGIMLYRRFSATPIGFDERGLYHNYGNNENADQCLIMFMFSTANQGF